MHAVDGHVAEARLSAANLDVLAFAFIAFERYAGQAADGIGDVGIWQAGDDLGGEDLYDIVGGAFTIERLNLAALAFAANDDLFVDRLELKCCIGIHTGSRSNGNILGKRLKAYIRNRERVFTRR